eukprot:TRINITY_DN6195_c0_g3_i1.p1 TRINITY_DN6195_c0_g3~~TRINITY_DN6195_c0_g3_i1.p1  ORF type:complete len:905 (+),score=207.76 TRINITY_DN6195_c0_g3_i1:164-2878(+)
MAGNRPSVSDIASLRANAEAYASFRSAEAPSDRCGGQANDSDMAKEDCTVEFDEEDMIPAERPETVPVLVGKDSTADVQATSPADEYVDVAAEEAAGTAKKMFTASAGIADQDVSYSRLRLLLSREREENIETGSSAEKENGNYMNLKVVDRPPARHKQRGKKVRAMGGAGQGRDKGDRDGSETGEDADDDDDDDGAEGEAQEAERIQEEKEDRNEEEEHETEKPEEDGKQDTRGTLEDLEEEEKATEKEASENNEKSEMKVNDGGDRRDEKEWEQSGEAVTEEETQQQEKNEKILRKLLEEHRTEQAEQEEQKEEPKERQDHNQDDMEVGDEDDVGKEKETGTEEEKETDRNDTPGGVRAGGSVAITGHPLDVGDGNTAAAASTEHSLASVVHSDSIDPKIIRDLAEFVKKRAERASNDVAELVAKQLPAAIATAGGVPSLRSAPSGDFTSACNVGREIAAASGRLCEQARRSEQKLLGQLRKLGKIEGLQAVRDAVEKELAQVRNGTFTKAVLQASEGGAFCESFVVGLQAAPLTDKAAVREALVPTRVQIQDALKADLRQWCGDAVAEHGVFDGGGKGVNAASMCGATDAALHEVHAQALQSLSQLVSEIRSIADSTVLQRACTIEVTRAIQRELKRWEARLECTIAAPAFGTPPSQTLESIGSRLRTMTQPVWDSMATAESAMKDTKTSLTKCRGAVEIVEFSAAVAAADKAATVASSGGDAGAAGTSSGGASLASARATIVEAVDAGRLPDAFQKALAWDARHQDAEVSLVEVACDRAAEVTEPEDVLAGVEMNGRMTLLLSFSILQRAAATSATVSRIEANLHWVMALLHKAEEMDDAYGAGLHGARPKMEAVLDQFIRGEAPASLSHASASERRSVSNTGRLVLKTLGTLSRLLRAP